MVFTTYLILNVGEPEECLHFEGEWAQVRTVLPPHELVQEYHISSHAVPLWPDVMKQKIESRFPRETNSIFLTVLLY